MYHRPPTIGEYLLRKLQSYDIEHIFGIPGDYVLRFYNLIEQSPIQHIGMTREDAAGYAADAYARTRGMGAVVHYLLRRWIINGERRRRCLCRKITCCCD